MQPAPMAAASGAATMQAVPMAVPAMALPATADATAAPVAVAAAAEPDPERTPPAVSLTMHPMASSTSFSPFAKAIVLQRMEIPPATVPPSMPPDFAAIPAARAIETCSAAPQLRASDLVVFEEIPVSCIRLAMPCFAAYLLNTFAVSVVPFSVTVSYCPALTLRAVSPMLFTVSLYWTL